MTLEEASPQFAQAVHANPAAQFNPLARWYRERPSQVAFAASILFHAVLISFVPGLRSVSVEPQRVLTVHIAEPVAAPEQPLLEKAVVRSPPVRESDPLPEPVVPPEFEPIIAQPRALEQTPVRPQQTLEPQPIPVVRQPEQSQPIEPVARADIAPPVSRNEFRPPPIIVARPDVAPAQPAIPVLETRPVRDVDRPDEPVTEVRRQPRAVPQVRSPVQPQPTPDVPRPAVQPVQVQQPVVAEPAAPVPPAVAPVARAAPPPVQTAPPVTAAPVQPRPQTVAPVIAMPAPQIPVLVVEPAALEAYRQSVSKEVMRHMRYPRVAVMRKWQGKTVVEMKLSADGEVIQVVVAESSGKDVLDDAALKMVRRSLPLPKPPQGVRTVTVPVVFRLQG